MSSSRRACRGGGLNSVAAAVRLRGDGEGWIIRLENLQVQSKDTEDDAFIPRARVVDVTFSSPLPPPPRQRDGALMSYRISEEASKTVTAPLTFCRGNAAKRVRHTRHANEIWQCPGYGIARVKWHNRRIGLVKIKFHCLHFFSLVRSLARDK